MRDFEAKYAIAHLIKKYNYVFTGPTASSRGWRRAVGEAIPGSGLTGLRWHTAELRAGLKEELQVRARSLMHTRSSHVG